MAKLAVWARSEERLWHLIYQDMYSENKAAFIPEQGGEHGSRALWEDSLGHEAYWQAVTAFLEKYFPTRPEKE